MKGSAREETSDRSAVVLPVYEHRKSAHGANCGCRDENVLRMLVVDLAA